MGFDALNVALEATALLKPIIERVELKDADLASQMKRAATSIPLNLAEGGKRRGKDREHMFRTASGSNAELRTALAVAVSWGYMYLDQPPTTWRSYSIASARCCGV